MSVQTFNDLFFNSTVFFAVYREHGDRFNCISGVEGFCGLRLIADALYGVSGDEFRVTAGVVAEIVELPGLEESYEFFITCLRPETGAPVQLSFSKHLTLHDAMKELVHVVRGGLCLDY